MKKELKNKDKVYFKRVLHSKNKIIGILQEQVTLIKSKFLDETIEDFGKYRKHIQKYERLDNEYLKIAENLKAKDFELGIYY